MDSGEKSLSEGAVSRRFHRAKKLGSRNSIRSRRMRKRNSPVIGGYGLGSFVYLASERLIHGETDKAAQEQVSGAGGQQQLVPCPKAVSNPFLATGGSG